jgi:hypothetical protein
MTRRRWTARSETIRIYWPITAISPGGPERYLFAAERELTAAGHQVFPFALAYRQNKPTPAAAHFPPPPIDGEFVRHGDRALTLREKFRLARKVIHDPAVYRAASEALQSERIEVVLTLQIAHYLYPEVLLAPATWPFRW